MFGDNGLTIEGIAKICHEANRAYCAAMGDNSQKPWEESPDWQRTSAISGVKFKLANPTAPPSMSHDSWLAEKIAAGWKYGPVKDSDKKEHPCCVPYDQLSVEEKAKDLLFGNVVMSFIHFAPTK